MKLGGTVTGSGELVLGPFPSGTMFTKFTSRGIFTSEIPSFAIELSTGSIGSGFVPGLTGAPWLKLTGGYIKFLVTSLDPFTQVSFFIGVKYPGD